MTSRRSLLLATAGAAFAAPALAQQPPPSKPVRLIVPFPAGGTADVLPRILAEKMRDAYPAGLVVENKSGAGGNIGGELVARSDPDGTTFLVSPPGPIAINHHLYKAMPFDPTKWVPVTVLATVPNVLAVSNRLPVKDAAEFVAYLKANPGKVSYASQGNGSTSHLTANLFMQLTGTQMIHVPYKGTAPALVDLVGGNVDVFFDNISSSATFHTGGKLRVLAVADEQRSPALPQVPTFTEARLPPMQAVTFFSMVAPPGMPAAAVDHMHKAVAQALALPDVKQRFQDQGAEPRGWSPERTGRFIRGESDKWSRVIQSSGVTVD
ncbi:Bug family tripartite tricarboxylate transporter substrate binding protein [Ramlibacter tataouinensis]|uniref:Candidate extracytoplasmic binding receptor n=1 Tax=Ramlibacter tataouinensis (strain ATCC BAA-407 / DSM 14655 / LMG 21543 / TTB310) TaxID=365046 RepID=F5Y682_RAMTT|nr:tripartite tricarboxylate transporter substrate binding protein [Ramlibacter tataouinensis]AEG92768.1 Candidate extracytoplasmic binding receptor [Ramlibacter tataouinensis TTB310]